MINTLRTIAASLSILILTACATNTVELESSAVFKQYPAVQELKQMIDKAEKQDLPNLAPQGYAQAVQDYDTAFKAAAKQKKDTNDLAQSGLINLRQAMKNAESSKVVLREVLDARQKSMEADAQNIFPEQFKELESELKTATSAIEKSDMEEAKNLRAKLIKAYSELELSALKTSTTKQAKAKIADAKKYHADEHAPKTFKLAQEELALALDVLSAGRTQVKKSEEHAALASYYAEKSKQITDLVIYFDQRDFSAEDTILWYQDQLEQVNKPFQQNLSFDKPNFDVVSGIQSQITTLLGELDAKQAALVSANENIALLEGRVESNDEKYQRDKAASQKAEARYKKIQSMFNDDEAYVYRQGNNVLLETHAFNFQVGNSEISSENYGLLEKIMDAIKVFDNPEVVIMGHTDSTGGDAINQQLSVKRAQTVTDFLKKVGKFAPNRISTRGYGESRPVASNETREGRERNRRIEVLIVNK
jgi:OmpA-OmpF porin, OOP family